MADFRKEFVALIICAFVLLTSDVAHALDLKGTLTKQNFTIANCQIASMTVKYHFGSLLGEPTINGIFKWEARGGTAADCLDYTTRILVQIAKGSIHYGYIELAPTVSKAGQGYGYNATGSPNWGSLIIKEEIQENESQQESKKKYLYFSADDAKSLWKDGFSAVSFEVVSGGKEKEGEQEEKKVKGEDKVVDEDKRNDDFWSTSGNSPLDRYLAKIKKQQTAEDTLSSGSLGATADRDRQQQAGSNTAGSDGSDKASDRAVDSLGESLVGTWETSNGKNRWILNSDGTGRLVQESINNMPGTATTYVEWSANMSSRKFSYIITRIKLEGSAYDTEKQVTDEKKHTVSFTLTGNEFLIGNQTFYKR